MVLRSHGVTTLKQSGIGRVTSWQLVGAQLRHFRKLAGLTQAALAERPRVGEDTIASIEQGRRALQLDCASRWRGSRGRGATRRWSRTSCSTSRTR
ncbi:helix-turn-helix transcriptional regulator [Streptomyces luridiscabiei]|uniref:helix-turn-helix transcriptional regulator n=1 Tax=Streptomyces luridiscabiei TaxID=164114 RepID=UPI002D2189FE|nr:helix-turn-helix domain-containing protein [Streptomyces luridiscabiei]